MRRPSRRFAGAALLPALALLLFLVWALSPFQSYEGASVTQVIPPGSSGGAVASLLHRAGVIRSPGFFRILLKLSRAAGSLQAGEYVFHGSVGPLEVRRRLLAGDVLLHQVTVPEGLRMEEIFEVFVGRGLGTVPGFEAASRQVELLEDLDPEAQDLEGYLFPDTYRIPRGLSEKEILKAMVARFHAEFGSKDIERAGVLGLTPRQVITLASMVEREVSVPEERALVASVFHNRLRQGMLLQCDPTVIYALASNGKYEGKLTRRGLAFDSPYNTYLYPGLPPGPIASPGRESIEATLAPADTAYLYFVSMNTGRHHFSQSHAEHQRAVNRYQRRVRRK